MRVLYVYVCDSCVFCVYVFDMCFGIENVLLFSGYVIVGVNGVLCLLLLNVLRVCVVVLCCRSV